MAARWFGAACNVAFLSNGLWTPHPFTLCAAPNGRFIRMSIKAVGDFTRCARELTPGTHAVLEGPLGAFTIRASTRQKLLMVAGGIGITPIRALMESMAAAGRDVVLLYAAKTANDLVFASELRALTARCHFILSRPDVPATLTAVRASRTLSLLLRMRPLLRMLGRALPGGGMR